MIIDFHTHCFPGHVAVKAMPILAKSSCIPPCFNGTPEGLLEAMDACGVDACVVANIATNPRQQRAVNDFAIALGQAQPRMAAFGSVHPEAPDALEELRRLKQAGIKGVKLHPDYQHFFVDESRMFPIYHEIARLGLVTLFHAGIDIGYPSPVHCPPERLLRALPEFAGAPVVAAHFGGFMQWREVLKHLCGQDVYFDTSYCASRIPPDWAREIIAAHGPGRILFGSDAPWGDPRHELALVRGLDLAKDNLAGILGGNAAKLLGIRNA